MRGSSRSVCAFVAAVAIGSAAMTGTMTGPASAQGLFEALFGGISRAIRGETRQVSAPQAYAPERGDPVTRFFDDLTGQRRGERIAAAPGSSGSSRGFCVRTCDGSYFPVQSRPGMSAAEACSSFCPASETKVFAGSNIDHAVARDGQRYSDLPNAFVYRQKLVDGCSCNGSAPAASPRSRPRPIRPASGRYRRHGRRPGLYAEPARRLGSRRSICREQVRARDACQHQDRDPSRRACRRGRRHHRQHQRRCRH